MRTHSRQLAFILAIFLCSTLACNFVTQGFRGRPAANDATSAPAVVDATLLGEEYRSETGGFSLRKINGYDFYEVIGIVHMTAPDAQQDIGPLVMVVGGLNDDAMTAEDLIAKTRQDTSAMTLTDAERVTVAGQDAWQMDVSGTYDGQPVTGRMLVAMVNPFQQFTMLAMGPASRWNELEPLYAAVVTSIAFFDAQPQDGEALAMPEDPVAAEQPAGNQEGTAGVLRQWAISAQAKSQYGNSDWSAMQAVGAPDVDECEDSVRAWAPLKPTGLDWLEVSYDTPVVPTEINIYQNYNPSQVYEVDVIDTNGDTYILWAGEPEWVDSCPDVMTITIELDEELLTQTVRILVDQDVLGMGWAEIDAVELVGTPAAGQAVPPAAAQQPTPAQPPAMPDVGSAPTNYEGWMAGPVYQGWLKVIPGQTKVEDLDTLIGLAGRRSTENWKPRPTHADTFIYDLKQDKMVAYISVDTSGVVYKKSISPNTYPSDFQLDTVNPDTYQQLNAIFKRDQMIPYPVMAGMLESPGFLSENVLREDGRMEANYSWYNARGDRIIGIFFDGKLTGMAGLALIPKQ